jgi:hypothetical protein
VICARPPRGLLLVELAADNPGLVASVERTMKAAVKALIVHPAFPLTVRSPPHQEPAIAKLPLHVLHNIAEHLETAQDLLCFGSVCTTCRWGRAVQAVPACRA